MDGLGVLRDAIATLPVPAAPPRLSMEGAAVGLGFLDAALRLNHVRRLTERLRIIEHRIAHRITEVDISTNLLTDAQLGAARSLQTLTTQSTTANVAADNEPDGVLWVPVARLSRVNVGQVDVYDSAGSRLPRLTQYETSRLVASGLYRLLRGILVSHPDALNVETDLGAVLYRIHEPRWLIQAAILTLMTEVSKPQITRSPAQAQRPDDASGKLDPYRDMALRVFDHYAGILEDFAQLLDVAINDHILVVALDSRHDEHLLTYESPLYVDKRDRWTQRISHLLRASHEGYYVRYVTDIPTTLRSYHLVAEATQGVNIERILLTTNAHEKEVTALSRDLAFIADHLGPDSPETDENSVARDLELQVLIRQLAEVMRRCRWEASAAGVSLPRRCVASCLALVDAGEAYESAAHRRELDGQAESGPLAVSAATVLKAAAEIENYELRYDVSLETQPTSSRAHVYWRRPPPGPVSSGRTQIRAGMILRNAAETSARTVFIYALGVAAIAFAVACLITKSTWPYFSRYDHLFASMPDRDAIVAVALLVPGFLYARLELPEHNTVASHLRTMPRLIAYACIVSMAALAADIAAGSAGWFTRLAFASATGVPLLAAALLIRIGTRHSGTAQALARLDAPRWVTCQDAATVGRMQPDVSFSSVGDSL